MSEDKIMNKEMIPFYCSLKNHISTFIDQLRFTVRSIDADGVQLSKWIIDKIFGKLESLAAA
jgi:hypothetical protein